MTEAPARSLRRWTSGTLSRRRWLTAGLGLAAAPLLDAWNARAQAETWPRRLILMFNPNGTIQDSFWPSVVRSESDFDLSEILSPLAAHRDHLLLLKGLGIAVAETGPGGPHQKGVGGLFTGNMLQSGDFVDGDGSRAGWADGESVDQAIAAQVGGQTLISSLELGVRATEPEVRGRISYAGPGAPLPPQNDPLLVYQRLFSDFNLSPEELGRLRMQRLSVLDTVESQFAELLPTLGSADRARLEEHLTLVRGVERRLDLMASMSGQCGLAAAPVPMAPDDETTMSEVSRLQIDLLVAALSCDVTRVASLQYSTAVNAIRYPWLDSMGQGHTLSHAGPSNADARAELITRATWHAGEVAYLLDALARVPEGDGTLLDHTLLVWGNELGLGNTHTHSDIPFLLAGGGAGFRMGRFLDFGGIPHNRLLVSLLNAFGVGRDAFGHPDFASGALSGLT